MSRAALLVDDDPQVRLVTSALLEDLGFAVTEAATPREGLKVIEAGGEFDVLVTDIMMPGMDGWEFAQHVRVSRPAIPVLYTSGFSTEAGRPVRGSRILWKPFGLAAMAGALAELLNV
jgi:two-component system cell cycle sensor histidine kinase/response regulator CckA